MATRRRTEQGPRIATYDRISEDREKLQLGIERQHEDNLALAARLYPGVQVVRFSDNDISALKRKHRPAFEQMREAIESGQANTIVCYHPNRLTRNVRQLEDLIDLLNGHNVTVHTVMAGEYDVSNASARQVVRLFGALAQGDSEMKGELVARKHKQLRDNGQRCGGPRPFGYTNAKCQEIVPVEAAVIRHAFAAIEDGETLTTIARWINEQGVLTNGHKPTTWNHRSLWYHLRAAHLAGLLRHQGTIMPGKWEPIIEPGQWHRVQALLSDPNRKKRAPAEPYLLHGLVFTAQGHHPMPGKLNMSDRRKLRFYAGPGATVRQEDLDDLVLESVFGVCRFGVHVSGDGDAKARREAEDEVAALRAKITRLDAEWQAGKMDDDRFYANNAPLHAALVEAEGRRAMHSSVNDDLMALVCAPGALEAQWGSLSMGTKRKALRLLLHEVLIDPSPVRGGPGARLSEHPERARLMWKVRRVGR